jgi:hypothetical protein
MREAYEPQVGAVTFSWGIQVTRDIVESVFEYCIEALPALHPKLNVIGCFGSIPSSS